MDCVFDIGPRQHAGTSHEHKADAFTLSYLRRVPELAELARRVARYNRKRKARDEREKEKSRASSSSRRVTRTSKVDAIATDAKMAKRLFVMAIRVMYDEGSIVYSDGNGTRTWDAEEAEWLQDREDGIWKVRRGDDTHTIITHTTVGTTSVTLTTIGNTTRQAIVDESDLSEPDLDEESYIPVTPSILAQPILDAIRAVVIQKGKVAQGGATIAEILEALRGKLDERWARVGDWAVGNALEVMEEDEMVGKTAQGRWTVY